MEIVIRIQIDDAEDVKVKVEQDETESESKRNGSQYARFFDESCTGWSKEPEANLMFLKQQQNYSNEMLRRRGYLFLNEVYDQLGIPRTKAGQIVGWIFNKGNPIGDNRVDFGIFNEGNKSFVNGYEKSILLDFNVDGNILGDI